MKREEIIKALECLASEHDVFCKGCAYQRHEGLKCRREMAKDALSLIKELTAENERSHASCTELTQNLHECKSVTVREMQERLTSFFANDDTLEYIEVDAEYINEQISQTANEMIGETK